MRPLCTKAAVLFLLLGAAWTMAQDSSQKPAPKVADPKAEQKKSGSIEDLLSQALKNNPDIKVAEAKVREAEAALNKARHEVVAKVMLKNAEIKAVKISLDEASRRFERAMTLFRAKSISTEELGIAEVTKLKLQAELGKVEAELPPLLGKQPPGLVINEILLFEESIANLDTVVRLHGAARAKVVEVQIVPATQAEKLRKALDTPVEVRISNASLNDALTYLQDKMQGINLHIGSNNLVEAQVQFQLQKPVPVGAVFQWLEDQLDCRFVIRDYGIVATERERIPPGAVLVHDFWKNKVKTEAPPK
ncbi:MAG: hypothetical protein L0215_23330 [Gemmataceae bacterium]|nr:hypothetical protein [Gemmataceae bacterium]